ncbi:fimbrial protein [Citrobacter braakii]|uniref:fimbrial protein n=1 Tax=Citrobacter braakii TaxID=57706 RepID=UPI003974D2E2
MKIPRQTNTRRKILLLLFLASIFPWSLCHAECNFSNGGPATVAFENLTLGTSLDKNTPVNTILYDNYQHSTISGNIVCDSGTQNYSEGFATLPAPQVGGDVCLYKLLLTDGSDSGLGIKIYYDLKSSYNKPSTYCLEYPKRRSIAHAGNSFTTQGNFRIIVQVIGELHSGTIDFSRFSDVGISWDDLLGFSMVFSNTFLDIKALTCNINTPDIPVSLSPASGINAETTFKGINSTSTPVDFNIDLTCDEGTSVALRFEGNTQNGSSKVLKLTDQDNSATGLGVQILDKNKNAITFNQPDYTLQVSDVQQSQVSLPFSAQYIQTENEVTGGKADAEATFYLSFP